MAFDREIISKLFKLSERSAARDRVQQLSKILVFLSVAWMTSTSAQETELDFKSINIKLLRMAKAIN